MALIDLSKHEQRLNESRRRVETVSRFEEADRVPVQITEAGSFYCSMFGIDIRDYYTDLETQVDVQSRGLKWRLEELQDDRPLASLYMDLGPVGEAIAFDLDLVFPPGTSPWIICPLKTPEDIRKWTPPDPAANPRIDWFYRRFEKFRTIAEKKDIGVPVDQARAGIHPPLSAACAIMDPADFYVLMIEDPQTADLLLKKLFDFYCRLTDWQDERLGTKTVRLGLCDDNSCAISDDLYRKMVLPYNLALYERYGTQYRHLHADGPNDQHFKTYAEIIRLDAMDIGGFSDLHAAVRDMKGKIVIYGALNNRDFYGPFDDRSKAIVDDQLRTAGPGGGYVLAVGGETYAGVPPQTLIDLVRYAKERGRYPLWREDFEMQDDRKEEHDLRAARAAMREKAKT